MKIEGDWITRPETQAVCRMLTEAGHQAFFVGGCVRNTLLGAPVSDIDISTDAWPDQVTAAAAAAGLKPVPTGVDHGTVTVVSNHVPHEVTTFREDVEHFGRHATVAFSDDVTHDARRRDFTMNALYAYPDGTLFDPLGGLTDLNARRVRFIEDPVERIREDYLRILRFFRFHAWYGDPAAGMDADALAAVAEHTEGLEALSRERVGSEVLKLLGAPDPAPSVAAMRSTGVLPLILPGADDSALAPLVHLEGIAGAAPDSVRRLAALGGGDAERLRLSKVQTRKLQRLRDAIGAGQSVVELGYRYGQDDGLDILLLRAAMLEQPFDPAQMEHLERGSIARFPVVAADLMPAFSGPALGAQLDALESRWIASGFTLTREELLSSGGPEA